MQRLFLDDNQRRICFGLDSTILSKQSFQLWTILSPDKFVIIRISNKTATGEDSCSLIDYRPGGTVGWLWNLRSEQGNQARQATQSGPANPCQPHLEALHNGTATFDALQDPLLE